MPRVMLDLTATSQRNKKPSTNTILTFNFYFFVWILCMDLKRHLECKREVRTFASHLSRGNSNRT
jgi:hypothetical protein